MPSPTPLTESELDNIIKTIPNSRDRARMMVHLSVVRGWNIKQELSESDAMDAIAVVENTSKTPVPTMPSKVEAHAVEAGPNDIEWEANGKVWVLKRYPDANGCSWELFDSQGLRISEGRTTSGDDERARKDNARKQARRIFNKVTREVSQGVPVRSRA